MSIKAFNQLASDFLGDLARVFPEDEIVAKAMALFSAAVSINDSSSVPLLTFLNGDKVAEINTLERTMFEIPKTHMRFLIAEMNEENKRILASYLENLTFVIRKLQTEYTALNAQISEVKQGDMYKTVQNMMSNPQELVATLSQNPEMIEMFAETVSQNSNIMESANILGGSLEDVMDTLKNNPALLQGLLPKPS